MELVPLEEESFIANEPILIEDQWRLGKKEKITTFFEQINNHRKHFVIDPTFSKFFDPERCRLDFRVLKLQNKGPSLLVEG